MIRPLWLLAAAAVPACGSSGTGGGQVGVPPIGGREAPPSSSDPALGGYESPGASQDPPGDASSGNCFPCEGYLHCSLTPTESAYTSLDPIQGGDGCSLSALGGRVILECGGAVLGQSCSGQGCSSTVVGIWRRGGDGSLTLCDSEGTSSCVVCTPSDGGPILVPGGHSGSQPFDAGFGYRGAGD